MRKSLLLMALLGLAFLAGCKKQEEILIPDNVAPPDGTVDDVTLESYINRSYISLLGRKPTEAEFSAGVTALRQNNVSQANREGFLDGIMGQGEYDQRRFNVGKALLLNSADTSEIRFQIDLFTLLLTQPQYEPFWPVITEERDRLVDVLDIPADLQAGTIDMPEVHRRLVHNYFYDQINMGTQNFVISMYQNFLFRYPTDAELASAETMVNGFTSTAFLQSGRTKEDFIAIFLASSDYYEGQVRDVYSRTLYREPTTEEMETLSIAYHDDGDYEALLKKVLSSDEFVGI